MTVGVTGRGQEQGAGVGGWRKRGRDWHTARFQDTLIFNYTAVCRSAPNKHTQASARTHTAASDNTHSAASDNTHTRYSVNIAFHREKNKEGARDATGLQRTDLY